MFVEFGAAAGTCEIGCWLEPAAEGRGLITAACRMLLAYAFDERGLHRAEWRCRADNARSSAVAERLGMTLEGVLREAWKVVLYDKRAWSVLAGVVGLAHLQSRKANTHVSFRSSAVWRRSAPYSVASQRACFLEQQ